jgi:hypothetical protein
MIFMEKMNDKLESIIDKLEHIANELPLEKADPLYDLMLELGELIDDRVGPFIDITNSLTKIYQAKNQDYGNSFEMSLYKFGLVASIIRLSDKMNRIECLSQTKAKVKDESIEDTLLDLANYAIMTVIWLRKNRVNEE